MNEMLYRLCELEKQQYRKKAAPPLPNHLSSQTDIHEESKGKAVQDYRSVARRTIPGNCA
jgi:hypothetical protein